ncbi:MAG: hypothetical protein JSV86_13755 [Gemmatimonadota bacterium]|nr:MAG: hypothetical protein JSV86_13755 [Gemmatimonadota bacterium]
MTNVSRFTPVVAALAVLLLQAPVELAAQDATFTPELLEELRFRSIGPAVTGGRIHDVQALPDDPSTIYLATASGGIWKTTNKGTTWAPIFDDQPVSTFGVVAIAPSNPDVIWAGTGEQNNRQSTSWGNGVYRSLDAGKTWTHLGLEGTRHIGGIAVHPDDPDIAYVAALGSLWAASRERGVYKTTDGGASWSQVLFVDTLTGVVDLLMDPSEPNTLYAAAYQRLRRTWGFNGGGRGSGIYKTTDGGGTWQKIESGIPSGDKGRIGLAIAQTNPRVLNAIVEHASESGVYRTEDGGATWEKVNRLDPRPMYYSHIYIDPTNENRIYVLATSFYKSEDGGRNFRTMPTRPTYDVGVHSDFHALWVDPQNSEHFYLVGDAGLHETWDRGETYIRINNLPIGQFYAIGVDMRDPYYVYGGMQDNHSWVGPSRTRHWIGIINDDWRQIGFGDGMYHQPDPSDYRFVYGAAENGTLLRLDPETGDRLDIEPYTPQGEAAYRFDWVTPVLVSRYDPRTVYLGGHRLFISRDCGVSWERTEDLTRGTDRDTLQLMGVLGSEPMLSKNDGTSSFGEITTISESPLDPNILWVGTDDGNVQVSRDGGYTWTEVSRNVAGVADGTYVSRVIASASGPGVAFVTFDAHRDGDLAPYVFKTNNFGGSWTPLTDGLPSQSPVNVIVEHPANPDLLVLGTEHALFVSGNAGAAWTRFMPNLPTTLYDDLVVHPRDDDLIVGTHGRSIWILDDLSPLVNWSEEVAQLRAYLFPIRPATIFQYWKDTSYRGQAAYAGANPAEEAILSYHLSRPVDGVTISVTNERGDIVRQLEGPGTAGVIHRIYWDLRHEPPPFERGDRGGEALPVLPHPTVPRGPFVAPGPYTVTLRAGRAQSVQTVEVGGDPLLWLTYEDWRDRETFLLAVLDLQRRAWDADQRAEALRERVVAERDSLGAGVEVPEELAARVDSLTALARRIRRIRSSVYRLAGAYNGDGVRQGSLYPPTQDHRRSLRDLEEELVRELAVLEGGEAAAGATG